MKGVISALKRIFPNSERLTKYFYVPDCIATISFGCPSEWIHLSGRRTLQRPVMLFNNAEDPALYSHFQNIIMQKIEHIGIAVKNLEYPYRCLKNC